MCAYDVLKCVIFRLVFAAIEMVAQLPLPPQTAICMHCMSTTVATAAGGHFFFHFIYLSVAGIFSRHRCAQQTNNMRDKLICIQLYIYVRRPRVTCLSFNSFIHLLLLFYCLLTFIAVDPSLHRFGTFQKLFSTTFTLFSSSRFVTADISKCWKQCERTPNHCIRTKLNNIVLYYRYCGDSELFLDTVSAEWRRRQIPKHLFHSPIHKSKSGKTRRTCFSSMKTIDAPTTITATKK